MNHDDVIEFAPPSLGHASDASEAIPGFDGALAADDADEVLFVYLVDLDS